MFPVGLARDINRNSPLTWAKGKENKSNKVLSEGIGLDRAMMRHTVAPMPKKGATFLVLKLLAPDYCFAIILPPVYQVDYCLSIIFGI